MRWFESYLSQRSLHVRIEETLSKTHIVNSGVPQGSHLAPLLFLVYINTLPDSLTHTSPYLFADDVTLLLKHQEDTPLDENLTHLQADLGNCQHWARAIHGQFSPEKTAIMANYDHLPSSSVSMDNIPLHVERKVVHLGVTISPDLKFSDHFDSIFKRFQQRVNLLCFMGRHMTPPTIALLYKSYVRPTIEYAIPVWSFRATAAQLSMLDILQAKVCRRLLKSGRIEFDINESKDTLNRSCQLESLSFRRLYISIIVLFKYIHFNPHYLALSHITITKSARRPNKLVFNSHGRIASSLFLHQIGNLWNCLPPQLTSITSLPKFKKQFHEHLCKYRYNCKGITLHF